jgi:hypothetical protein
MRRKVLRLGMVLSGVLLATARWQATGAESQADEIDRLVRLWTFSE